MNRYPRNMIGYGANPPDADWPGAAKVAVILPCYNEEGAIAKTVADFRAALPDAEIYVYDNNSKDETAKIAAEHGAIVRHEPRQGKGNVVRSMFRDIDAELSDPCGPDRLEQAGITACCLLDASWRVPALPGEKQQYLVAVHHSLPASENEIAVCVTSTRMSR